MKKAVPLLVTCGLLLATSPALGGSPTLRGSVGPSDTIRLVTKPKKGGSTGSRSATSHRFVCDPHADEMRGSFTVRR